MTTVGPDLLLPGVASKRPAPATDAETTSPSNGDGDAETFAHELDAVVSPPPAAGTATAESEASETLPGSPSTNGTGEVAAPTSGATTGAPTNGANETVAPIDATELHLFGSDQQGETPATPFPTAPLDGTAVEPNGELAGLVTAQENVDEALAVGGEALVSSSESPMPATFTPTPNVAISNRDPQPSGDRPSVLDTEAVIETNLVSETIDPALAAVALSPDTPPAMRPAEPGHTAQGNGLLSTVAGPNGISGPDMMHQGQGQAAGVASSTPTPSQNQGTGPTVLTANLTLDASALTSADTDGSQNNNLQNNDKAALRTAASLSTDGKPSEPASGQSFSSTLSAAATEAANQSARGAAQAVAQRPARPAQTAPATAQIAVHIVRAVGDGVTRFNVQLQPAELGRVEVKLEVNRDGAVRAMVTADRPETVDQLQRDSRALERALQEAGLKADSQNLHFSLRGGQNGRGLSENRTSLDNSGDADLTEVPEPALAAHWSNVAGSTGALDIRV